MVTNAIFNTLATLGGKTTAINNCLDSRQCQYGYSCLAVGANFECVKCDPQCKSCSLAYPIIGKCTQCYSQSTLFNQLTIPPGSCVIDHADFSQFVDPFTIAVPPAIQYRVTMDFWMWVHDTTKVNNSVINLIYSDFLSISISQSTLSNLNLNAYCTPIEYLYPVQTFLNRGNLQTQLDITLQAFYLKDIYLLASSKWIFTRCAFQYDLSKAYMNQVVEAILPVPQQYSTLNNYPWFQKKYYKPTQTTNFRIEGHGSFGTNVYFRNVNVFREYMPQNMVNIKYFNLHKLTSQSNFPQLLFSIGLDDITIIAGPTTTFNWKDYSLRTTGAVVTNPVTTFTLLTPATSILQPPRNFQRLNYLNPNTKYTNLDLTLNGAIDLINCSATSPLFYQYCYNDLPPEPYTCKSGYYLDPTTTPFTCNQKCPTGMMRFPDDTPNNNNDYCLNTCDPSNTVCPYSVSQYMTITNFTCSAGFINMYYKCIINTSQWVNSALQFSTTLNTQSFSIQLPSTYKGFILDVWIYPDMRYAAPNTLDIIFMTDNITVRYNSLGFATVDVIFGAVVFTYNAVDNLNLTCWNRMTIYSDAILTKNITYYYATFNLKVYQVWPTPIAIPPTANRAGFSGMSKIYFCNQDPTFYANCNKNWINGFYKQLRIWNTIYTNIFAATNVSQYLDLQPYNLPNYFKFDLGGISFNKIQDSYNPAVFGTFSINSSLPTENPDNNNMFNFESNYAWEDVNTGQYITAFSLVKTKVSVTSFTVCNVACFNCWGGSNANCFECAPGYGKVGSSCQKNYNVAYYFYRNPPTNPIAKLSLNITPYNLPNVPGITLFFFLKLYGFTTNAYNIIYFDQPNNFYLAYNPVAFDGSLELYFNNVLQFQYQYFRSQYFGRWTPISISMYRVVFPNLFPNMVSMTVYYNTLPLLDTTMRSYTLAEISFPPTWIGLISDIVVYNTFIVSAWGLKKFFTDYQNNLKFEYANFNMKSTSVSSCLTDAQILTTTTTAIGLICVADFNPHLDPPCPSPQTEYVDASDNTNCGGRCSCANPSRCLTDEGVGGCVANNIGCEHKDPNWTAYQLYWVNNAGPAFGPANLTNWIQCGYSNGIDLARFYSGTINKISTPTAVFNIDVWLYTQSYITAPSSNFGSITILWDKHIKIVYSYTFASNKWAATCTPVIDASTPANDPIPITNNLGIGTVNDRQWIYFNCGVDASNSKFYFINGVAVPLGTPFTSINTIPSLGTVTLSINDSSPNGYGVSYFRQLRLWTCYSCSVPFRNIIFAAGNINFLNVLHAWDGSNNSGGNMADMQGGGLVVPPAGTAFTGNFVERPVFMGYNILWSVGNPVLCAEVNFYFYNSFKNKCDRIINQNRLPDYFFPTIPASRTNRYTLELWVYIENTQQLTYGVNFIYDRHIGITIIRNFSTFTSLTVICFPQEYRDNLNGVSGAGVYNLINSALNSEQDIIPFASSTWIFIRCAVDLDRQTYYLDLTANVAMAPETIYGTFTNFRQYRFYDIPQYVNLYVQNQQINLTRMFFKYMNVYRDYIAVNLINLQYRDMKQFISNAFFPLVFSVDFDDYLWGSGCPACGLQYRYNDVDAGLSGITYFTTFLAVTSNPIYTTYPIYDILIFCGATSKGTGQFSACANIVTPGCNLTTNFCYDNGQYFYFKGMYINMVNLTANLTCPANATRMPDSLSATSSDAYCNFPCPAVNNINSCGSSIIQLPAGVLLYEASFTCNIGYTKVYYDCILTASMPFSALYMSQFYSWSNLLIDFTLTPPLKSSYYLEFWFLLDNINGPATATATNYYFLAPPHFIIKSSLDQSFKYGNFNISGGTLLFNISSISTYEWNRVILYLQKDLVNLVYNIQIFTNYNFVNPDVNITGLSTLVNNFDLLGIAFCNKPHATCIINAITYNPVWGTAWYRNIRVWDDSVTSPYMIQSFNNSFTELLKSIYYFYPFTADTIFQNSVLETMSPLTASMKTNFWYYGLIYDDDLRLNYSINYDYIASNLGNYVNGINSVSEMPQTSGCDPACRRCYTSSSSNCYSCTAGYALYGTTCYLATGYYFKIPTNNLAITNVILTTNILTPVLFNISTTNPITITFWMKFMGVQNSAPAIAKYPIIYLNGLTTYFGFDPIAKAIVLVINGIVAFSNPNIKKYVGIWTHFGISSYVSLTPTLFPHMFNFMIQNVIQVPLPAFVVPSTSVTFNQINFSTQCVAFFASLKFYSNFFEGTYGNVTATGIVQSQNLILEIRLYGSGPSNCVSDAELFGMTVLGINLACAGDYNPYFQTSIACNNDNKYFDLTLTAISPPCALCDVSCTTECYTSGITGCSCSFNSNLYWITTQIPITSYYCHPVTSINYAFYNSITVPNIAISVNQEMTIEFWLYVYSYVPGKFGSLNISWDKHNRVQVIFGGGVLNVNCFAFVDMSNFAAYTSYYNVGLTERNWYYIRCSVNTYTGKYYVMNYPEVAYAMPIPSYSTTKTTTLTIADDMSLLVNWNYGFSFVRELKLYSIYQFPIWNASSINLNPINYQYLLHFFKNTYTTGNAIMSDLVTLTSTVLIQKTALIGYNYVVNYVDFNTCNEGQVFNTAIGACQAFASPSCKVASDINNDCLVCPAFNKFLMSNGTCASNCGVGLYSDSYLNQCRICDLSCYTCTYKFVNNCSSCTGTSFLVPALSICAADCAAYGLTISLAGSNLCGPFTALAVITNYNITFPINPHLLTQIVGKVFNATATNYTTNWRFDNVRTNALDSNYTPPVVLNTAGPFIGATNNLIANVDPTFFKEKFTYAFFLDILYTSPLFNNVVVSREFDLIMNNFPQNGSLIPVPPIGYGNSTNFLLKCANWIDDNTISTNLLYKFTYFSMFNSTTEIMIQDYSNQNEANSILNLPPGATNFNFTVNCYIQDSMAAVNSTNVSIAVYSDPSTSGVNLPLSSILAGNDFNVSSLTPPQLYKRTLLVKSLGMDYARPYIFNQTQIYPQTGVANITMNDPICSPQFCNNRGVCQLVDKFLTCTCNNYYGSNCQIDSASYSALYSAYTSLWGQLYQTLTTDASGYVIPGLGNLLNGASYFMIDSSMMLQIINYIPLAEKMYPHTLILNSNDYFGYYSSLINYGVIMVNQLKVQNYINLSPNGPNNFTDVRNYSLSYAQQSQMGSYYAQVKSSLQSLILYLGQNINDITSSVIYQSSNLNVYVSVVTNNFNFTSFFANNTLNYDAYFDASACLTYAMKNRYSLTSYKLIMTYVNYKQTPYIFSHDLYFNNSSPLVGLSFYDFATQQAITIDNCNTAPLLMYYPVINQNLPTFINNKRSLMDPSKQYPLTSSIFNDPIYINITGAVTNDTISMRIDKYFMAVNFTCDFYSDATGGYDSTACTFSNYTFNNYFVCKCNHLTDFVVNFFNIDAKFNINSRFFYLNHYQLLMYPGNYYLNVGFYLLMAVFFLYISVILFYSLCDCYIFRKLNILDYLKNQIIKLNLPYRRIYNFNIDMIFDSEAVHRIKQGSRFASQKARLEQDNLDLPDNDMKIRDIDVMVLGDNISQVKVLKEPGKFFKHKKDATSKVVDKSSRFFQGEENIEDENKNDKKVKKEVKSKFFAGDDEDPNDNQDTKNDFVFDDERNEIEMKENEEDNKIETNDNVIIPNNKKKKFEKELDSAMNFFDSNKFNLADLEKLSREKEQNKDLIFTGLDDQYDHNESVILRQGDVDKNNYLDGQDREPEIVVKSKIKRDIGELEDYLDELPKLPKNLTSEARLQEFGSNELTFCEFFKRNLSNRHIFLISLFKISVVYGSFKRIGILCSTACLMMFILSIFFTLDESIIFSNFFSNFFILAKFIVYCILTGMGASILTYPLGWLFYIQMPAFRKLYWTIIANPGLTILKDWQKLSRKNYCSNFWGIVTHFLIFAGSFYVSFGFCAVYQTQANTWLIGMIFTILFDFFVLEIVWEFIIALLYKCRRRGRKMLVFSEFINRIRLMKTLT